MSVPLGAPSGSRSVQPVGSSKATEAASTVYFHGEKNRTWPHWRIEAPTARPASSTSGVSPRASRCAAAARPTGPAPITATGKPVVFEEVRLVVEVVDVFTVEKPRFAGGSAAGEAVDQPLERIDDGRLVQAVVDLATLLARPDQTGALQDQEVVRNGRAAQRDARGDIADVEFLTREDLDQ